MITKEQLQAFCSKDETRPALAQPYSAGDYTYATDNRILVRVPRLADVPDGDDSKLSISAADLLTKHPAGPQWFPVPPLPPRPADVPCTRCGGKPKPPCAACHDSGEVEYEFWHGPTKYGHTSDCPVCNGERQCRRCDGTGIEPRETVGVEVGGILFNGDFLCLLAGLDGAELAPRGPYDPCRVRFVGGEGLVMPLRRI